MDLGERLAFFHVTSSLNRDSIDQYGLDWKRMGPARGIAGSYIPEQEGCFLCRSVSEADWFVRMGSRRGPVDVWAIEQVDESALLESPEHHYFVPFEIPRSQLTLLRKDVRVEVVGTLRGPEENAALQAWLERYRRRT